MDVTIERLVRILDEERAARGAAERNRADAYSKMMETHALLTKTEQRRDHYLKERDEEAGKVRQWQKWRDDLKEKTPTAKQASWPEAPDYDDIPF